MNKENYNPNSVKHNGDWHNEHNSGTWEQHEEKFRNKNVPRHREGWSDESYNQTGEIKYSSVCEAIENSNLKHFFPHDYCTSIGAENKQFRLDIINEIHS